MKDNWWFCSESSSEKEEKVLAEKVKSLLEMNYKNAQLSPKVKSGIRKWALGGNSPKN